jgi:co-chaperonin GroES (HSP10)
MFEEMSILDEDTTSLESPDPDLSKERIPNHSIVVRPVHIVGKTKSGVILPSKTKHDIAYLTNVCKVLKLGDTAYTQEMFEKTGPWCKEGDYVLIPKLSGQKIKFKGIPLILISCDKVLWVLGNPEDVDPNFNISTELLS